MMPSLTLNTEAVPSKASQQQQQQQPAANRTSASVPNSSNTPARPFQSTTPIPVPLPISYTPREQPQASPRSSSPVRPTYSPITPPLNATTFPPRPTYTHSSHVDATAAPAPRPEAIDFDRNPDVLALKSAISILQMQRKKAGRDIAALDLVKRTALAEPESFVRDLTAGRVHVEGEGLFVGSVKDEDIDSDSSSEGDKPNQKYKETKRIHPQPTAEEKPDIKLDNIETPGPPPWTSIPKPQNIVRCPPINWSQYAIVGESLDKLHNEQLQRPTQGSPAALTPEGRFEFKGGDSGGVGRQEQYVGIAAPYAPGKDKIDRRSKTPSKR
ncbi:hypothetical protein ANO14919_124780 [Xylariales sp. No.14919]|nr:hypothetical protein ANO14919_124780 [Xylariales sp. No.14919]